MQVPHQTHPDQFEFQHELLDHPFGQNTMFFFIARYSSPWPNSVRSSREVLEGIRRDSIRWKGELLSSISYGRHVHWFAPFAISHIVNFHSLSDFVHVSHNDRIKFTISFCFSIFWDEIYKKKTSSTHRFSAADYLFALADMFIYFLPS